MATRAPAEAKASVNFSNYEANPVGALQEIYQRRGVAPRYNLAPPEGALHCPTFMIEVEVDDGLVARGSGSSKKQAKSAAARAMLDLMVAAGSVKLEGCIPMIQQLGTPAVGTPKFASATDNQDEKIVVNGAQASTSSEVVNRVGHLNEYCFKEGLPLAEYEAVSESGPPHEKVFEMMARVGSVESRGKGSTKKEAKRIAATRMLEKLTLQEPADKCVEGTNGLLAPSKGPKVKVDVLSDKYRKEVEKFWRGFRIRDGGKLHELIDANPFGGSTVGDLTVFLQELGTEQKFSVTFVALEEKTDCGEFQCLVELSTVPFAVTCGFGKDVEEAAQNSARNALQYLKLMTKKALAGTSRAGQPADRRDDGVATAELKEGGKEAETKSFSRRVAAHI